MRFTWDENKNRANRAKHRVSFETATFVFEDAAALIERDRVTDGEERWNAIGMVGSLMLLTVCHAYRGSDGEEVIRIISARKADRHEREKYYRQFVS